MNAVASGTDELAERAIALWLQTAAGSRPDSVETLKAARRKSTVLRLVGAGPDGTPVVAKRASRDSIALEERVYRDVLSRLSVSAPRLYGVEADDPFAWLFVEDAGEAKFDPALPGHLALAGRWMGRAHGEARSPATAAGLPERGPGHYRALQRSVDALLRDVLINPSLRGEENAVVAELLERVAALGSSWAVVESHFEGCPRTLVLGGFGSKNARVLGPAEEPRLMPFDFESAGCGCPAIDLVYVDGDTYLDEARSWWRDLDAAGFDRLQGLGRMLRALKAIPGERSVLLGPSPARAVGKLRWYLRELEAVGA